MKLTGKTREDFENWILNECPFTFGKSLIKIHKQKYFFISYLGIDNIQLNALIIEFFDSVGIYIWTMPSLRVKTKWTFRVFKTLLEDYVNQHAYIYKSRKEATGKAIEKANEIYNEMLNKC